MPGNVNLLHVSQAPSSVSVAKQFPMPCCIHESLQLYNQQECSFHDVDTINTITRKCTCLSRSFISKTTKTLTIKFGSGGLCYKSCQMLSIWSVCLHYKPYFTQSLYRTLINFLLQSSSSKKIGDRVHQI